MKEQDLKDSLLYLGKRRGFVTEGELTEALPSEFFALDELEQFLGDLEGQGIKVINYGTRPRTRTGHNHISARISE